MTKRGFERAFQGLVCLAILAFGIRAVWTALQTETGIAMLTVQWRDATLGWVSGRYEPVSSREPAEQAEFWLQETARIVGAEPDDATLSMGAALMLDAPSGGYARRYMTFEEGLLWFAVIPRLDYEALQRVEDEFERRCGIRCLELAERACRLEPDEVAWWRLRAILQFRPAPHGGPGGPRSPRWLEVLEECRQRDPGNGLYDYLAARQFWESSADLEFCGEDTYLKVHDTTDFHRGVQRFRRAQSKPYVSMGVEGFPATEQFLRRTLVPRFDHANLVNHRQIWTRRSVYLRDVWRWWTFRAEEHERAGDVAEAWDTHRENLRLLDQYRAGDASQEHDLVANALRAGTTELLLSLVQEHPARFSSSALADAQRQARTARREQSALGAAYSRRNPPRSRPTGLYLGWASSVGFAPGAVVILLLLSILGGLAGWWLDDASPGAMGAFGHSVAWLAALVITLVLFGFAPAEVIPASVQGGAVVGTVAAGVTAAFGYTVWRRLKKHRFQYSLRTLLLLVLVSPVALLAAVSVASLIEILLPVLHIPARTWENLDFRLLKNVAASQGWPTVPLFVLVQWNLYHGPYLTIVLWAALVAFVTLVRSRGDLGRRVFSRTRWVCLPRALGKPAIAAAVFHLAAYLAMVPRMISVAEADFQEKIALARNPESHWAEVRQAVAAIRAEGAATKTKTPD